MRRWIEDLFWHIESWNWSTIAPRLIGIAVIGLGKRIARRRRGKK